jgi:hypothetical protein
MAREETGMAREETDSTKGASVRRETDSVPRKGFNQSKYGAMFHVLLIFCKRTKFPHVYIVLPMERTDLARELTSAYKSKSKSTSVFFRRRFGSV